MQSIELISLTWFYGRFAMTGTFSQEKICHFAAQPKVQRPIQAALLVKTSAMAPAKHGVTQVCACHLHFDSICHAQCHSAACPYPGVLNPRRPGRPWSGPFLNSFIFHRHWFLCWLRYLSYGVGATVWWASMGRLGSLQEIYTSGSTNLGPWSVTVKHWDKHERRLSCNFQSIRFSQAHLQRLYFVTLYFSSILLYTGNVD